MTATNPPVADSELALLLEAIEPLGPPETWRRPPGYPQSLALCILDSIWSLGANYDGHVVPVLNRYRALRSASAAEDSASDLLRTIDECGGPAGFAEAVSNRQLTSTRGGVLKAEAAHRAAKVMVEAGIETPLELQAHADFVGASWRKLPGQRSSSTGWRYLLLLAGASEAKPDRMILRFVSRAINRTCTPDEAHALITAAADRLGLDLPALDHRIWLFQSGRLNRA